MKIMNATKKITLATIKSFLRNAKNLHICKKSMFDGMTDCVMPTADRKFETASYTCNALYNTLGIQGAWFVRDSDDYFAAYEDDTFKGYEVHNCCGSFLLVTPK